jgi:hypothetical protein
LENKLRNGKLFIITPNGYTFEIIEKHIYFCHWQIKVYVSLISLDFVKNNSIKLDGVEINSPIPIEQEKKKSKNSRIEIPV